jgi:hypothetical protein
MTRDAKELVAAAVKAMPHPQFAFDELRKHVPAEYDALRDAIFDLLDEPNPTIVQAFDEESKSIHFVRVDR